MKKFALATIMLAMGTALIAAPQADKSKAPTTTTGTKSGEKGKASKKGKTKGDKEKDKGTKLHDHTN